MGVSDPLVVSAVVVVVDAAGSTTVVFWVFTGRTPKTTSSAKSSRMLTPPERNTPTPDRSFFMVDLRSFMPWSVRSAASAARPGESSCHADSCILPAYGTPEP